MRIRDLPNGETRAPSRTRSRNRRRGRALALAALCATAGGALAAATASALIVQVHGTTLSYAPTHQAAVQTQKRTGLSPAASATRSPVEYNGGPVMPSNTNYALYWDPSGAPAYPAGYQTGLDRYFEDLSADSGGLQNTDSVLAQYKDAAGEFAAYNSHFGGALPDADPYPASGCSAASACLTDEQLRTELRKYVEAHALPADLQHEYFILTPPGVESCMETAGRSCSAGTTRAAFCAYHGFIETAKGPIVYANDPYVGGLDCDFGEEHPNGVADATIAGGLAHEHSESVTDPKLNAWFDSGGREVGDKCRTFKQASEYGEPLGKAPDGSNYNQVISGDLYWYQQEWSNETGECSQRAAQRPAVTKSKPKSGSAAGGTLVTITGAAFKAPASVSFGTTPASEVTIVSATTIQAVAPPGSAGTVDVTVTTAAGTSPVNAKVHFKYKRR